MTDLHRHSDDPLDTLLRRGFDGPVPDDGFTLRVMQALPPRRPSRPWLLPVSAAAGTVLAWLALSPSPVWQQAASEWLQGNLGAATLGLAFITFAITTATCAWSLEGP